MAQVKLVNNTGERIYYFINNGRNDYGFIDDGNEIISGNADAQGVVTIESFRVVDDPNARTAWVNALAVLPKNPKTLEQILFDNSINSIEEI